MEVKGEYTGRDNQIRGQGQGHLWDKLETQDNGNSQESMRVTLAMSNMEPETVIFYSQKRLPMEEPQRSHRKLDNFSCLQDVQG